MKFGRRRKEGGRQLTEFQCAEDDERGVVSYVEHPQLSYDEILFCNILSEYCKRIRGDLERQEMKIWKIILPLS